MSPKQQDAFYAASGLHANGLNFDVRLFVGGITLIIAVLILAGLMHLLDSGSPWDKMVFFLSVFGLSFVLMLIFIYVA
ncbi:MAG TPA: hypothetical protein VHZ76_00160 [Gammaproteobacteria bacterium]|jgi:hypothetical protein|nr:hypothetical protein [Gammaproteobacteria bacterium]